MELAKLCLVVLAVPPLLKTRLEALRIILSKQEISALQHPALTTNTHPSAALDACRTLSWLSRDCSLQIPIALSGEKSSSRLADGQGGEVQSEIQTSAPALFHLGCAHRPHRGREGEDAVGSSLLQDV